MILKVRYVGLLHCGFFTLRRNYFNLILEHITGIMHLWNTLFDFFKYIISCFAHSIDHTFPGNIIVEVTFCLAIFLEHLFPDVLLTIFPLL